MKPNASIKSTHSEAYKRGRDYATQVLSQHAHNSPEVQALWEGVRYDNDHFGLGALHELREQNIIQLKVEKKERLTTKFWRGVAAYATFKMEKSRG